MERESGAPEHGRPAAERDRIENTGIEDETIATDDVDQLPGEGMTVDDV